MLVHAAPLPQREEAGNSTALRRPNETDFLSIDNNIMVLSAHSTQAGRAVAEGNYRKAIDCYRLALSEYLEGTPSVVELVNAAATCFNLGALSKKLFEYEEAASYFCQAEKTYQSCLQSIQKTSSQARSADVSCEVCLYKLIVETLQARAHLLYKHLNAIDEAIECHEEVVLLFEQRISEDHDVTICRVKFVAIGTKERRKLLISSLQSLGKLYVERGDFEDGLIAYQEALSVLRDFGSESTFTRQRQIEIRQIVKVLSNVYMKKLSTKVPQLQRLARMEEDSKQWDRAIACWERILYLESQEHGQESSPVADALCQIARVMTLQGNGEGALDLYHAAFMKYNNNNAPLPREAVGNTTNIFCQLQLHDAGLDYLDELIKDARTVEEEAWILCQRGRIYLEQGRLHDAGQALCQSAQLIDSEDDYVFKLLQRVEFLQQRTDPIHPAHSTLPATKTQLESITEDDENSGISGEKSQLAWRSLGPSISQPLLKTVDEQRQEDVVTPDDDDFMVVRPKSEDRATRRLEILGSVEDTPFCDDIPSDENNSDSEISSDERKGDFGSESTLFPMQSQTLPIAPTVTPPKILEKDGDCEVISKTEQSTERSPKNSPQSMPPNLDAKQAMDLMFSESLYISSDDESTYFNDDDSQSDKLPEATKDAVEVGEQQSQEESLSPSMLNTVESEVEEQPKDFTRDIQDHDALKHSVTNEGPSKCSIDVHLLAGSEIAEIQAQVDMDVNDGPQETTQDMTVPGSSPESTPNEDLAAQSQVYRRTSSRSRLVMALSSPFRRTRTKKSGVDGTLGALDEEKEINEFTARWKSDPMLAGDDVSTGFDGAPVSYIAMRNRRIEGDGDDDESLVSQITFRWEESKPQKSSNDNQWWWGVTSEGLEGWFPTSYVHQAVEAAEGFLSARAIHDKVKDRPLDFESDEESEYSESDGDQTYGEQSKEEGIPTNTYIPTKYESGSGKKTKKALKTPAHRADRATKTSVSSPKRKTALASQIEEKQAHLEDQSISGDNGDSTTAVILFELASLQSKNGEFGEALKNSQQALQLQKASNNTEDACKTLQFMADLNSRAKYYQAALSCYAEAQKIQEAINGYYHEEVANILNRQGNVLARQGEFDLAMENHREALRILKECSGEEVKNPLVSQTLIQIGAVYYKERNSLKTIQKNRDGYTTFIESGMLEVIARAHEDRGSYRMAIAFFEEKLQCLNIEKSSEDRKQIAETLNSLGMLSCRAGLYLEAMEYYDRAGGIQKELGCDDIQLAMAKVLSASVQYFLGHFQKALKLLEVALQSMRANAGVEQETVAATLFHMGVVRVALGDYGIGTTNLRDAMKIQKKLLGPDHPATLRTRREMANLLVSWESNVDRGLEEYRDILEIQKRIHGAKHPNIAETLHFVGCAEARSGDKTQALRTLEACYNMRLEFLGADHPLQATTLHKISEIQLQKGRIKRAINTCDSAILIRKESLNENHVDVAGLLATKASCLVARGSFNEASKLFAEACKITSGAVGLNHPAYAAIQVQMGAMHLRTCHFEEAAASISAAVDVYRRSGFGDDHPVIKDALEELEQVERAEMLCV
jgi:tetratricopeptide (TPR) repeat protein